MSGTKANEDWSTRKRNKAMTSYKPIILILTFLLTLLLPTSLAAQEGSDDPIDALMRRLSVADKVGQLFIVPFVGTNTAADSEIGQLLREYRIGGVILLAANSNFSNTASTPRQITHISNNLQTLAFNTNRLPLLMAVDHEGDGFPYTRITGGVTAIPSPMAIGATWNTEYAEAVGQIVGEELAAMGINLVLGPSVDVLHNPRPTERGDIGIRVFGGDPYWVGQFGRAYIRGVHLGGQGQVATVAKHFPGHGGSDRLPDNEVATVDKSLQELKRIELPPFFEVMADRENDPLGETDALMSSHIRYRGFQGDIRQFTAPISFDADGMATLFALPQISAWRERGGIIVSDALGVPAVRRHFDPHRENFPHRQIAKEAFLAGNDVLSLVEFASRSVWSEQLANIKDTVTFFQSEYRTNLTFARRVDEAVERILRLKFKLHPDPTLDSLPQSPEAALAVAAKRRPIISEIAQQGLTLLYPSAEEVRQRLPQPPRSDEQILIVADVRLSRDCYTAECELEPLYLAPNSLQETILRFYGPPGTGQIQPSNIDTITFAELKLALQGAIESSFAAAQLPDVELSLSGRLPPPPPVAAPPTPTPTVNETNPLVRHSIVEVRRRIQAADWLIFAMLDLNTRGFSHSDALKLFLAQESGTLRDKKTIVLALNAPYYLDTTEVTKLTAFYGVYSKTQPHLEAVARLLFGEIDAPSHSPVSVDGIGYRLVDALSPDSEQALPMTLLEVAPDNRVIPVSVRVEVGPIFDRNGNLVPDGTPVEIVAESPDATRQMAAVLGHTESGLAVETLLINEAGRVRLAASAGFATTAEQIDLSLVAPTATPTLTRPPVETATPTLTATSAPLAPSQTVTPTTTTSPVEATLPAPVATLTSRSVDTFDLWASFGATFMASWLGLLMGGHGSRSQRLRQALWGVIGGLLTYLLYGVGLLQPEVWLFPQADLLLSRVMLVGLVLTGGLLFIGVGWVEIKRR